MEDAERHISLTPPAVGEQSMHGKSSGIQKQAGPFSALRRHRHLFLQLLKRDVQTTLRGSILGMGWIVVTPLVLVGIYTFVFGFVLQTSWFTETNSPLHVPLIYFTGLTVFSLFMEVISRSPEFVRANRTYVTKIVFPVEILSWVLVGTASVKYAASLALLVIFLLFVTGGLPPAILMLPLVLAPFVTMLLGISWYLSAIGTYLRDLNQLVQAIGPVLMFISPIFYSIDQVPETARIIFWANPLTFILETMRGLLFFDTPVNWSAYAIYWMVAIAVFLSGFAFFKRAGRQFADVI